MKGEIVVKDTTQLNIPKWIKNNAAWWAGGEIDDETFATGIEFMIKENIISLPTTDNVGNDKTMIPDWIRNNALWWSNDQIDDNTFASAIQFLVKSGIIIV